MSAPAAVAALLAWIGVDEGLLDADEMADVLDEWRARDRSLDPLLRDRLATPPIAEPPSDWPS